VSRRQPFLSDGSIGAGGTGRATTPDRGSASLELAILGPALLLLLGLVIAAGRIAVSGGAIEAAARDAARQASIARDAASATTSARAAAVDTLADQDLQCTSLTVQVDTGGFAAPLGTPAQVTARVSCVVALADLAVPGLPGTKTLHASFASPLDSYRERR
jgi:Flp pilus assembly protein TadG